MTQTEVPTLAQINEQIDARIEVLEARQTELTADLDAVETELETLRHTRHLQNGSKPPAKKRAAKKPKEPKKPKDANFDHTRAAGPGNVRIVEDLLVRVGGAATQHTLTERSGLHSGTVSHALRALEQRGRVRPTGNSVRRSKEYEIIGSTMAPPGS